MTDSLAGCRRVGERTFDGCHMRSFTWTKGATNQQDNPGRILISLAGCTFAALRPVRHCYHEHEF